MLQVLRESKPGGHPSQNQALAYLLIPLLKFAFTLSHGIVNEVYYPTEDVACIRDMGLIVTDGKDFFSEEKRHCTHDIKMLRKGIPAYRISNTCIENKYQITKEIITDPIRNTLLQNINFKSTDKGTYKLFVLLAPHLNNQGNNNTGWVFWKEANRWENKNFEVQVAEE
ncbi:MAG: hypothetical protein ABI772_10455 [Bacteroidota bacterium]